MSNSIKKITKLNLGSASILAVMAMMPSLSAQEASDEIDEIVITVERRTQSLQDLAGTAATFSGDDLKAIGVQNLDDLDGSVPGLSIANNQGNLEVFIRGVGSSNNTELGDPAAATHLNGVYVPRPSGIGASFFDIQRVEVNIGPQGTLRGRNATAGSVNIIPWAPGIGIRDFGVEASIGNFGETRLEAVANIPVTENSAFRISGFTSEHDSYFNSVTPDSSELGLDIPTSEDEGVGVAEAADDFGVRAAYKIEATQDLTFTLTGDFLSQQGTGYTGINFANPLGNGIRPEDIDDPRDVVGRGFTPVEDTEHWGLKAHIEYDAGLFNVEYIGSYRDLVYDYEFVTPASPFYEGVFDVLGPLDIDNFSRIRFTTDSESSVHELRFFSDDDQKLIWTAGAFYFTEDQRTFLGTTGDRNPFFQGVEFNQTTETENYSVYADATYSVTDKFRVTGGIRYSNDTKQRFGINARYAFGIGGPDFGCCFTNGLALGTEGFEFAGLDRSIIIPDANGDGTVDATESIAFFFDGIAQFGARDGFDNAFPNGQQIQDAIPNAADREQCDGNFAFVGSCANGIVPDFDGVIDFSLAPFNSTFAVQNGRLENDFVDWRLRAEYDITEDNLVYGLISTGNKSGGFNDNIPDTAGLGIANAADNAPVAFDTDTLAPTYDPETLTLFELGSKNQFDWGETRVTFNASAFFYDYSDLQLTTLLSTAQVLDFTGIEVSEDDLMNVGGNVVGFTFNAANAEIYGAQFETGFRFDNGWNLKTNLLFLETEIVESQEIQDSRFQADVSPVEAVNQSIEGNELPRTPNLQFNASLSRSFDTNIGQVDVIGSGGYRSEQFMTIFNSIDFQNPDDPRLRLNDEVESYWTFDAGLGFKPNTPHDITFEAYINNITDEQKEQAIIITQFDNTRFFNRPRTYGVRARYKF